jgi:hypothetical protein
MVLYHQNYDFIIRFPFEYVLERKQPDTRETVVCYKRTQFLAS